MDFEKGTRRCHPSPTKDKKRQARETPSALRQTIPNSGPLMTSGFPDDPAACALHHHRREDSRRPANPLNRLPSMPATLAHDQPLIANYHAPADERDIKMAVGRDYADVPPLRGHYKGSLERQLEVAVLVERLDDSP